MYLELLKIRASQPGLGAVSAVLDKLDSPPLPPEGPENIRTFSGFPHPNECMLAFWWRGEPAGIHGSALARDIAERLQPHGLVDLSLWTESTMGFPVRYDLA